jgi:hypothetical protein
LDPTLDQILMMEAEMVPETSVVFDQLTRMLAREGFINLSRLENISSYVARHLRLNKINNSVIRELGNFN